MRRARMVLALWALLLRHALRNRPALVMMLLIPVGALLTVAFFSFLEREADGMAFSVPGLSPRHVVLVVEGRLPGLEVDAATAAARLARHPGFDVRLVPADPGAEALRARRAHLIVAAAEGGTVILAPAGQDALARMARDLLAHAGGAPPAGGPVDIAPVLAPPVSGLAQLAPYFVALVLIMACMQAGPVNFVEEQRSGRLRPFLLSPMPRAAVLAGGVMTVGLMALAAAAALLGSYALLGVLPGLRPVEALLASALGAVALSGIGFAAVAFDPTKPNRGVGWLVNLMILLLVGVNIVAGAQDPEPGVNWLVTLIPPGALLDLLRGASLGVETHSPAWANALSLLAWGGIAWTVALARFNAALEPDWNMRWQHRSD